jgi:predicted dehydrogenase
MSVAHKETVAHSIDVARPRVGFLGVGWIGRHRMEAIVATNLVDVVGIADAQVDAARAAASLAPGAVVGVSLDELLELQLDGMVIATPSALHAEQAVRALEAGCAVFCQKPLGRSTAEVCAVVDAARRADRLLAVDLSYRFTRGMQKIRALTVKGQLGRIYAVDLVFHNAYGPDKAWFYDPALAGGGCVMDLGIHLIDLALWVLDFPSVETVQAALLADGLPLAAAKGKAEDYAAATITLGTGTVVRLACSWRLQAGRDAIISAGFYGTEGGAAFTNIDGSFYDFSAERFHGTARESLAAPPDAWGGRAAADWATRLARGEGFNPDIEAIIPVSQVLDRIYGA